MVKKVTYTLDKDYVIDEFKEVASMETKNNIALHLNHEIHHMLKDHKNFITDYFWSKRWDKCKKYANDYELIFTTGNNAPSISSYIPISRSFFKLWEIVKDNEEILRFDRNEPMKCAFLAEGPGGFIECFAHYRKTKFLDDCVYGITLISSDRNIPCWKIPINLMHKNVRLLSGEDRTGSLYKLSNIHSYINTIGVGTCHFVTADGGFDFSNDFNGQEELSMHLISAEIYTAIKVQRVGGSFLLKLFDIDTVASFHLLYLLKRAYTSIKFIKPLSSRPANSEKYILCNDLKNIDRDALLAPLYQCLLSADTANTARTIPSNHALLNQSIPYVFIQDVVQFNVYYIARQILHINKTLCMINCIPTDTEDADHPMFKAAVMRQLRQAIKWCNKYKIQINLASIKEWKSRIGSG
jgi:23S rRNA U2552 (ribose-2'-O)-methylase RlmE/FtsJ